MPELSQEILDGVEVLLSGESEPPSEIVLFKAGFNETSKGRFLFDSEAASSVLAAFSSHGADALPFDASHLMLTSDNPEAKKALGWFVPKVSEAGDLLASDIRWTPKTAQALKDREYRFHSPAIRFDGETRRIRQLINVALTNLPATKNQPPLMLSEGDDKGNPMKLFELLGAEDEGAAVVALEAERAEKVALLSERDALKEQTEALSAEIKSIKDEAAKVARAAKLDALSAEGKLKPAQRAFAETLSDEQLEAFAATLSSVSGKVEETEKPVAKLSDEEKAVVRKLGLKEEEYLSAKSARKDDAE